MKDMDNYWVFTPKSSVFNIKKDILMIYQVTDIKIGLAMTGL